MELKFGTEHALIMRDGREYPLKISLKGIK
jgi:hypothetical protein